MHLRNLIQFTFCFSIICHASVAQNIDDLLKMIDSESNIEQSLYEKTNSLEASATVTDISESTPPLTIQDYKELAVSTLKAGLLQTASSYFDILMAYANENTFSRYGKALILTQQGKLEKAFVLAEELSYERSSFQKSAKKLKDQLILLLAQESLDHNQFAQVEKYLSMYTQEDADRAERQHFERLLSALNRHEMLKKGINPQTTPFKIALLLPLSGTHHEMGEQLLKAAQLALFNNPNPNILLYPHDTKSTPMGAIHAAQKAIHDQANIILGPLTAENTKAIKSYTMSTGIPVFSFSSSKKLAHPLLKTLGYDIEKQAQIIAQFAVDQGVKNVAILSPRDEYGQLMTQAFQNQITTLDVSISDIVYFDPQSSDQTKQLQQLAQTEKAKKILQEELKLLEDEYALIGEAMSDASLTRLNELKTASPEPIVEFDALFLPVDAYKLPLIASQLAYYNMDAKHIKLLGTAQWQDTSIYNDKAEYVQGGLFPSTPMIKTHKIYKQFKDVYNITPHPLTIIAYDGVTLLSQLYEESDNNFRNFLDITNKQEGFSLAGGTLRFSKQNTPSRLYSIYEIGRRKSKEIQPAPSQFPPALPRQIDAREGRKFDFFSPWSFN